ncbi:methenyltetrahydromethanopterin cyclohydrolase [Haloarcula salinisoli]|uniref:Methenyltetrahydromethanopterin cyclohydrolase n=1 Tax=Haloarcula salinisoli TaxID=2487746 RepID=A0A8J7YLF8_9EURY|nr:methenyltetrahydromethanopterin cyclohydrolase [Halomicroarcula salinisoli]MBX0287504.1 methenyltetrahydromethanopterin cyclohydrolase [Halomicroarcula salinisoli]MBX0304924.1 methenyltetrahydromethanopterin cyclohydrolase [Halomicroarcula salinisoli]
MDTLNRMATELVDEAIDFADELTIDVHALDGDAAVLDFGVEVPGAVEAGLVLAELQTAGLATVQTGMEQVGAAPLTHVELGTDHPALALLCSQKGGWELTTDDFEGLGSGPARALVAEEDIFGRIGYREEEQFAVLAVETDQLPDQAVAAQVAERTGVPETGVFLPAFATASVTGSVVSAARAAEIAVFRLAELGYDPAEVLSANGRAPVAPVAADEATAMARTTDALAYGSEVHLTVDEPVGDVVDEVPSIAGAEYGRPLDGVFEDVDWDFAELPVELFGPAKVTIDVVGGETHVVGETHEDVLVESFGL